jgi:predicted RNA binding protein YcfA (HicA-like mRNA interferase family)
LKQRELITYLKSLGFSEARSGKHIIYSNGVLSVAVPHHKDITVGTLRDILTTALGSRENAKQAMRNM